MESSVCVTVLTWRQCKCMSSQVLRSTHLSVFFCIPRPFESVLLIGFFSNARVDKVLLILQLKVNDLLSDTVC